MRMVKNRKYYEIYPAKVTAFNGVYSKALYPMNATALK